MPLEIWTAFVIGFLGSLHCVGMCGPIALSLPTGFSSRTKLFLSRLLYNMGRIITYSILGAICGVLGKTFVIAGFQQSLSITAGIMILLFVIFPSRFLQRLFPAETSIKISSKIKAIWGKLFQQNALSSLFVIGILNGLLPCGFLYMGLAAAASTGGVMSGSTYMAMFGLGTVPAILATSLFGSLLSPRVRRTLIKLLPIGGILLALLLILRGMSLGIPYVSPKINKQTTTQEPCCH